MKKNLLKALLLISMFCAMNTSFLMAAGVTRWFWYKGAWQYGTLYGKTVKLKNGKAYAEPPASLVLSNNEGFCSPQKGISIWSRIEPKERTGVRIENKLSDIFFDYSGISVLSKEPVMVSVYDVSDKLVYSVKDMTEILIKSSKLKDNSYYVLRLTDKSGDVSSHKFMVSDGATLYNWNK
ncbi:MAG: hypothetical protein ACOX09_00865 [Candidatus Kapaibacterium sp.]|jgi:hypothetical protein